MTKKQQQADLAQQIAQRSIEIIRKRFGATAAIVPGKEDARSEVRGVIPCGIDVIDRYVCGCGGLPQGRLIEMFSEPGVIKTGLCWTMLGGCQRMGGVGAYCDCEQSTDGKRMRVFGVDLDRLVLQQPLSLEEALEQMELTLEELPEPSPVPFLQTWDSLAESPYKGDLSSSDYGKEAADDRAKKIGRFCRVSATLATRKQATILIVNQTRQRRGLIFGSPTTTVGGDALKFYASLRLQLFNGKALKDEHGQHIGKAVTVMAFKTRFSPPFRKAKVRLDYAHGWDNLWSTISLAKDLGVVPKGDKYNVATYEKAVAALGWEGAAPAVELRSTEGIEEEISDGGE
jgi:recombination protein RecA